MDDPSYQAGEECDRDDDEEGAEAIDVGHGLEGGNASRAVCDGNDIAVAVVDGGSSSFCCGSGSCSWCGGS